jgi:hypothetical protein
MQLDDKIKRTILELASEDSYGSWELWGAVRQETAAADEVTLRNKFAEILNELIAASKLKALKYNSADGTYRECALDGTRLRYEIEHADNPDRDEFYWFGTTEKGEKEDLARRS